MILNDIEITKDIFSILSDGIVDGFESFIFRASLHDSYVESELNVTKDGVTTSNAKTNFNGAVLCDLLETLQKNATNRNEKWTGIVISYTKGGQVSVKYKYPEK